MAQDIGEKSYLDHSAQEIDDAINELPNKIGKTDYATPNKYGIVKLMTGGGLRVDGDEPVLCVNRANESDITAGTQEFKPIVPKTVAFMMNGYGIPDKNRINNHNTELARLIDSGAKNRVKTNSGSSVAAQRFIEIPLGEVTSGTYILYFGHLESTLSDVTCNVTIRDASNNTVTSPSEFQFVQGDGIYKEITLISDAATKIRIYSANTFAASENQVVTFSGAMLCSKAAWNISQAYVPYCPTVQELYQMTAPSAQMALTETTDN